MMKRRGIDLTIEMHQRARRLLLGGRYHYDMNNRDTLETRLNVFELDPKAAAHFKTSAPT